MIHIQGRVRRPTGEFNFLEAKVYGNVTGSTNAYVVEARPAKNGEVTRQINHTDDLLSNLEKAIEELYQNLQPVLAPALSGVDPDSEMQNETAVPMAHRISNQNQRLANMVSMINGLSTRLEL